MSSRRTSRKVRRNTNVRTKERGTSNPRRSRRRGLAAAAAAGDVEVLDAGEDLEDAPLLPKPSVHVAGITYQHEYVKCGKPKCGRCRRGAAHGHGPYWYAYWRVGAKVHKKYVGKVLRFGADGWRE